jgi:hypothetical protein
LLGVHNLYDPRQIDTLHHVQQALKAHAIFKRDVDYVVKDGEVIIVDEFTGRLMPGRRWSDGLHQAVEAKERVHIREENQTLATITIQNYFRMYKKLAGMTGTADTEATEFKKIYKLDVVVIPTHRNMIRIDHPDVVYRTENEKFDAVVEEIEERHKNGQPILVGNLRRKSERLSDAQEKSVKHNVLNAVNHEAEATIIARPADWARSRLRLTWPGAAPTFARRNRTFWPAPIWKTNGSAGRQTAGWGRRHEDALRELREIRRRSQKAEKRYLKDGELTSSNGATPLNGRLKFNGRSGAFALP